MSSPSDIFPAPSVAPPTTAGYIKIEPIDDATQTLSPLSLSSATPSRPTSIFDDDLNSIFHNDEISTLIIDAILEDDAARHHRSFVCPNPPKHYPLFRLRPHSDSIAKLCLVSKHMRHLVLSRLYKTLKFHGGGAGAQDEWDLFNSHMMVKDTSRVHLSQPKIYIQEIICKRPSQNKEYAENLFHLMHACPNLKRIDPSPISTHHFFTEKRLTLPVPPNVTELRCIAVQTKSHIWGVAGKTQDMFSDVGRLPRDALKKVFWKRDDFQCVTKLHIQPTFLEWRKVNLEEVPVKLEGKSTSMPEEEKWRVKLQRVGTENWGNLGALQDVSIDCREVKLWPHSAEDLEKWAVKRYHIRPAGIYPADPPVVIPPSIESMWKENRMTNLWFWTMLGNTTPLKELHQFEIDLEYNPWKPNGIYDEWYWLDKWITRLDVVARNLVVRLHVHSPIHYFSEMRRHLALPDDRSAENFKPGWLLNNLPEEQRMREVFGGSLNRDAKRQGKSGWKYLEVQLVAEKFPRSQKEIVILRRWHVSMDEHTKSLVHIGGGSTEKIYDTQFLEFADKFNTLDYMQRLETRLHGIPKALVGMI